MRSECIDCGKRYSDFGLDTVLSNDDWAKIHPEKDGLLCANCIVKRAAKLPRVVVVKMELDYREDYGI